VTETSTAAGGQQQEPRLDTNVPHSARVWNYWLGGKDNFAVDRQLGDEIRQVYPDIVEVARTARGFLARAVRYLVGEAGIRQFLDIGTGLPTANNTHEVAQSIAPQCRIVYVDNDPLVLVHARALLTSSPQGATDYIDADVRDTDRILQQAARTLDFTKPVAIIMQGILGYIPDDDEAHSILKRLLDAVPSGSYLAIGDGTKTSEVHADVERTAQEGGLDYHYRTPERIAAFFDGLELLEPGVVPMPRWRPDPGAEDATTEPAGRVGLARKP
jgi:O-methyltransferase involved in polyketide biosynthesis